MVKTIWIIRRYENKEKHLQINKSFIVNKEIMPILIFQTNL
jgi:hypothetical protein